MKMIFVISSSFFAFLLGALIGGLTLPEQTGLEGGTVVLVYGIIDVIIGLTLSLIFMNKLKPSLLKKFTIILVFINIIYIVWIIVRVQSNLPDQEQQQNKPQKKTDPVTAPATFFYRQDNEQTVMGIGMAKPDFFNKKVLYFYSVTNPEKSVSEYLPVDSLVFFQADHHQYDISYAPPWFYPVHLKMDYEILYLKVITFGRDWIEVEVNRQTGLTTWVSTTDVEILFWPEFLLTVFSVENLDPENNLLREKPLLHASPFLTTEFSFLSPVMVKESWLKVNLLDDNFNKIGEAWLRWHADGNLLISYSLLS